MSIDFHPETAVIYSDGRMHDVDYAAVQRFITADTPEKLFDFCNRLISLFGLGLRLLVPVIVDQDFVESAGEARDLLITALDMLRLANESQQDTNAFPDLSSLNITTTVVEGEMKELLVDRDSQTIKSMKSYGFGDPELEQRILRINGYHGLEKADEIIEVRFHFDIDRLHYVDLMRHLLNVNMLLTEIRSGINYFDAKPIVFDDKGEAHEVGEADDFNAMRLICRPGYFPNTEQGTKDALRVIADELFTLHLGDVRTVSSRGGQEERLISTGLSSLWWCALDNLRIGRLGACEVCGKPYIAQNERGKKRKYCSEACKQWHKVHPGEKRRPNTSPRGVLA